MKKAQTFDHVAGITILNDLTCRDLQKREAASGSRFIHDDQAKWPRLMKQAGIKLE
jgi:2-keto-4-pentenoate hydratase/2-oxohepta-3-ene-1,7-dioic acid hydratase in catechol pathway